MHQENHDLFKVYMNWMESVRTFSERAHKEKEKESALIADWEEAMKSQNVKRVETKGEENDYCCVHPLT